jgi:hypothetical protein
MRLHHALELVNKQLERLWEVAFLDEIKWKIIQSYAHRIPSNQEDKLSDVLSLNLGIVSVESTFQMTKTSDLRCALYVQSLA